MGLGKAQPLDLGIVRVGELVARQREEKRNWKTASLTMA
jgi:hypothetical protein